LDSARQIGVGGTSHELSDCSDSLSKGGEARSGNFFAMEFGLFLLVAPHTAVL